MYVLFAFLKIESTGSCTTKGGYGGCVFPFKFEGREHNSCTTSGGYAHWCAYSVDSNGVMTNWAYCRDNCKDTVYAPPGTHNKLPYDTIDANPVL